MWLFTQDGFVSVVDNGQSKGKLAVRARDTKSLEKLAELTSQKIVETTNTDYRYRVFVTRDELTSWMTSNIENLNYSNFKDRITKTRGIKYHDACMDVWCAMLQVSDHRDEMFNYSA